MLFRSAMLALLAQIENEFANDTPGGALQVARGEVHSAVHDLRETTATLLNLGATQPERALAVAVPYLMMCGFVLGGWLMLRAAKLVSSDAAQVDSEFAAAKLATARAYIGQLLPRALGYRQIVMNGSESVAEVAATLI